MKQEGRKTRIAVDGMGGDFAPTEIVRGAVEAAREGEVEIVLVGPKDRLGHELANCDAARLPIHLQHTDQFIQDGEPAAAALKAKPQASVAVCAQLAKVGQADAAVSMGHTGAAMIAAHWVFGPLPGVQRPVIGGPFSPLAPQTAAFDLGANAECKPEQFLQFAAVGIAYARCLLGVDDPTVGLLSNGVEPGKGTAQTRAAYDLLNKASLNFAGYVEGWDLASGRVNVVLCDGFLGNILVKYSAGLGGVLAQWWAQQLQGQLPESQCEKLMDEFLALVQRDERAGGGPLLGIDGVMVIGHGRSRVQAVTGAIQQARQAVESNLVATLRAELAKIAAVTSSLI
jgi:glycerol-3-phosphate acyltransferase PlsX